MSVIEMHSSWLAINSIVGCPNGCKYCFLKQINKNLIAPKVMVSAKEAIEELLESKYYDKKIPVCLLPNTDAFATRKNIDYVLSLFQEIENHNVLNDFVLITKSLIPDEVIHFAKRLQNENRKILFYFSFSGLGEKMEPVFSLENLQSNLKRVSEAGLAIVHNFRPFLPQNGTKEVIEEVLAVVKPYTDITNTTGLGVDEQLIEDILWPELKKKKKKAMAASSVWPKEAYDYFYKKRLTNQQTFQTNVCAFHAALRKPARIYYGTYECKKCNCCSLEQRKRCKAAYEKPERKQLIATCIILLQKLGFDVRHLSYRFDYYGGLELRGIPLQLSDVSYLSYMLNIKVYFHEKHKDSYAFRSSLTGKKPLVLRKVK